MLFIIIPLTACDIEERKKSLVTAKMIRSEIFSDLDANSGTHRSVAHQVQKDSQDNS